MDAELDVIVNGLLARAINATSARNDADGADATSQRLAFAENVVGIRTTDYFTATGGIPPIALFKDLSDSITRLQSSASSLVKLTSSTRISSDPRSGGRS